MLDIMLKIKKSKSSLTGTLSLPFSKSISNRLLILNAISNGKVKFRNLSEANDTQLLKNLINSKKRILNAGNAGTTFRFLTAYLAFNGERKILTGSTRMCQRPVGILVDALRKLGAKINYLGKKGYPPIEFLPSIPSFNYPPIEMSSNISSQFISALMMIAPALPDGLTLILKGKVSSYSYIKMTIALLKRSGIKVEQKKNHFHIPNQKFKSVTINVERDWSSAGYWFSIAAISGKSKFFINGLKHKSLQGDSVATLLFKQLGVDSIFTKKGVWIISGKRKNFKIPLEISYDFTNCPDLAQTVIACCAALGVNAKFTGLETLRIKETDRIGAMRNELKKFNCFLIEKHPTIKNRYWYLNSSRRIFPQKCKIETYKDHRMTMSFAPFSLKVNKFKIVNPEVVNKSYPGFWKDIKLVVHS
ncbi:MAG: hypothetical protein A3G23_14265 [Bacteroidetes bacterium RIFCSPLOWO2_12_FULL_37_12]|nr:MAG: hypothetical protein A3G23_14265 [Bacteroidetes bacterium RIFCSPLOWO2_12_FULL_37_12]